MSGDARDYPAIQELARPLDIRRKKRKLHQWASGESAVPSDHLATGIINIVRRS